MTSNVMKLSNGSRFQLEFISKHAKIILLVAFSLKNRNLLLLYSHKETKRLWFKNFIIIHCEITHKKEYLSICARNWSLNMHSHKIDSLHFIFTYTLNSRGGGAIWDGWDMSPKCSLALFEQYLALKTVIFATKMATSELLTHWKWYFVTKIVLTYCEKKLF